MPLSFRREGVSMLLHLPLLHRILPRKQTDLVMTPFKVFAFAFITFSACLTACGKCVHCTDCQGNNNQQDEEVCQKNFDDKDTYNAYVKNLETVGGCNCK